MRAKIRDSKIWFTALLTPNEFNKVPARLVPNDRKPIFIDLRESDYFQWELTWSYRHWSNNPKNPSERKGEYEGSRVKADGFPKYFEEWIDVSDGDGEEYDVVRIIVVNVDTIMNFAKKLAL